MTEFFASPLFIGGILIAIALFLLECANCLGHIKKDIATMRAIEQRRAAEESKIYVEALEREIAAHDARMARNQTSGAPEPRQP